MQDVYDTSSTFLRKMPNSPNTCGRLAIVDSELLGLVSPSLLHLEFMISDVKRGVFKFRLEDGDSQSLVFDPYEQFLRNVLSTTPLLQTFGLRYNHSKSATLPAPIVEYPRICRLFLSGLPNLRTIHTISGAESLVDLHINIPENLGFTPLRGFRNLQHLRVRGSLRAAYDFLEVISPQHLSSLEYKHHSWIEEDQRDFYAGRRRDILSLISHKFLSLCHLSIHFAFRAIPIQLRLPDAWRPLLHLRDLERVTLHLSVHALAWSDHDVRELGAAWPKLTDLQLHASYEPALPEELPSIYALAELARLCPNLVEIHIPPMRLAPPPTVGSDVVAVRLRLLKVICTPCDAADPIVVARFLEGIFPRLENLPHTVDELRDQVYTHGKMCVQWFEVLGHVRALQLSR
ncbi:hypothetical protein B0H21DRAFT_136890 [Amylocystis lapponica]|nr:hypothetical protein B0H21DRAFT_136890 [Amylocystis lapponica]